MCHLSLDTVPKISNPQCDQCVGSTWREPTVRRVHREVRHAAITCRLAPMTWNVSPSLRTTKLQTVCITCIQFLWFHDVPSKWQHGMFLRVSKYHIPAQEFYASNISKHRYLENRTSTSVLFSADSIPCRTRCLASSVHEDFYLKVKLLRYTHVAIWIVSYHACKDATRPISFAWAFCGHHECKLAVIMNQNASFLMWWKLKINHLPTQAYVHWKMIWCIYGCFHCCRTWKTITQTPPVLDDILSRADPVVCAPQGRVMTSTFPWQPVNRALPVTLSPGPKSPCGKTRCQHGQPDIFCRNQKTMSKQKPSIRQTEFTYQSELLSLKKIPELPYSWESARISCMANAFDPQGCLFHIIGGFLDIRCSYRWIDETSAAEGSTEGCGSKFHTSHFLHGSSRCCLAGWVLQPFTAFCQTVWQSVILTRSSSAAPSVPTSIQE